MWASLESTINVQKTKLISNHFVLIFHSNNDYLNLHIQQYIFLAPTQVKPLIIQPKPFPTNHPGPPIHLW